MNKAQLNFLRNAVGDKSGHGVIEAKTSNGKLKKGDPVKVLGRTSKYLHASQQGVVVVKCGPRQSAEAVILDCYVESVLGIKPTDVE